MTLKVLSNIMGYTFLYAAIALVIGLLSTRLMKKIKLPNVTGYLLTGIIIGPYVLGLFFNNFDFANANTGPIANIVTNNLSWISEVALGFIAFTIGTSFKMDSLKYVGKRVIVITIAEALGGALCVFVGIMILHFIFPSKITWELVLVLSAISCATAPAATLMVIKQYKARGPVVSTLLPVVALDDAAALIMFSILFTIAKTISLGSGFDIYRTILKPLIEITISLGCGALIGLIISLNFKFFKSRANRMIWSIAGILANIGLCYLFKLPILGEFELSSLLMCMMAGAIVVNLRSDSNATFEYIDKFTPPFFMLFFILSGATLDLTIFASKSAFIIIGIAFTYIIFRVIGKWLGAYSGAKVTNAEPQVQKFLGFTLIPQAGVAIGLATSAGKSFASINPMLGQMIVAIILTSTIVYELIGPVITKISLLNAGEITEEQI